jgi:hypothetical protein
MDVEVLLAALDLRLKIISNATDDMSISLSGSEFKDRSQNYSRFTILWIYDVRKVS